MNYKIMIKNFISSKFLYFYKLVIFQFFSYLHLFLHLFFFKNIDQFFIICKNKGSQIFLIKILILSKEF